MTDTATMLKPPKLVSRAVEFRATGSAGDGLTLEGYAAVFNDQTEIDSWEGSFVEEIARGAFSKTISERTPVLQFDHGQDARTGSVPIGKIDTIREDKTGLFVQARLFDNPVVEPIRQAIDGGAIDGMSFRFRVTREDWYDGNGDPVPASELGRLLWQPGDKAPLKRLIREVELFELGPVVFPAYEATSVGVRSFLAHLDEAERASLVTDLARELQLLTDGDAAPERGTSPDDDTTTSNTPDAGTVDATSGLTPRERRERLFPFLKETTDV